MTNEERYKTPEERMAAFNQMCDAKDCRICKFGALAGANMCVFAWLADEYEEPDLPFKVDIGTSIVGIRRTDTQEVIARKDHVVHTDLAICAIEQMCAALNAAAVAWHEKKLKEAK